MPCVMRKDSRPIAETEVLKLSVLSIKVATAVRRDAPFVAAVRSIVNSSAT